MQRLSLSLGLFLLLLLPLGAQAATIDLTWTYTQNPQRPATQFVLLRCTAVAPAPDCTPTADLPGAPELPVDRRGYTDTTAVENVINCYAVVAKDAAGRSLPGPRCCAGAFVVAQPGACTCSLR